MSAHLPGHDERGCDVLITIRITPDGRLFVHDITPDLLPALAAVCPNDRELALRAQIAAQISAQNAAAHRSCECEQLRSNQS